MAATFAADIVGAGAGPISLMELPGEYQFILWVVSKSAALFILGALGMDFLKSAGSYSARMAGERYANVLGGDSGNPNSPEFGRNMNSLGFASLRSGLAGFEKGFSEAGTLGFTPRRVLAGIGAGSHALIYGMPTPIQQRELAYVQRGLDEGKAKLKSARTHSRLMADVLKFTTDQRAAGTTSDAWLISAKLAYNLAKRNEARLIEKLKEQEERQDKIREAMKQGGGAGLLQEFQREAGITSSINLDDPFDPSTLRGKQSQYVYMLPTFENSNLSEAEFLQYNMENMAAYAQGKIADAEYKMDRAGDRLSPFDRGRIEGEIKDLSSAIGKADPQLISQGLEGLKNAGSVLD